MAKITRMRGKMSRIRRALMEALIIATALSGLGSSQQAVAAAEAAADGVELVGLLPEPPREVPGSGFVVDVDGSSREMFYLYRKQLDAGTAMYLAVYELGPRLPVLRRDIRLPESGFDPSPMRFARDRERGRLLLLNPRGDESTLRVLDLASGATVELLLPPGFFAEGFTYAEDDDLIYLVGEVPVPIVTGTNEIGRRPQVVTALLAVDPAIHLSGGSGTDLADIVWLTPLWRCQQPLNRFLFGAPVFRSGMRDAVYVPCIRSRVAPRVSGLLRIDLPAEPKRADPVEAMTFTTDFFPISGTYTAGQEASPTAQINGWSVYDPVADRVFLQSLSTSTPGAWVFDGGLEGWVGFIATPRPWDTVGFHAGLGHYYAANDGSGELLVSDGRGTPVPQGRIFPFPLKSYVIADASTNRIFGRISESDLGITSDCFGNECLRWIVLEDATPSEPAPERVVFDEQTHDIPEGPGTEVVFAGGLSGYGSRFLLVGGYGGLRRGLTDVTLSDAGLGPADRGAMLARVATVDVRRGASLAAAQALEPDSGTRGEWDTRPSTIALACRAVSGRLIAAEHALVPEEVRARIQPVRKGGVCDGSSYRGVADEASLGETLDQLPTVDETLADAASEVPLWPWPSVTCLDAGGASADERQANEANSAGSARVECSRAEATSVAAARYGPISAEGISVGSSTFKATARRDPDRGTIVEAVAVAEGIRIERPDVAISIAEVHARGVTAAWGRPGTAKVTYERSLSGIVVQQGGTATRLPDCAGSEEDVCRSQLEVINGTLGEFAQLKMPLPMLEATPRGAFSAIGKSDAAYFHGLTAQNDDTRAAPALQVVTFHDAESKSRLLVQFAAIEATSIYTISPALASEPFEPFQGLDEAISPGIGDVAFDSDGAGDVKIEEDRQGDTSLPPVARVARGALAFVVRSPLQALQVGAVLSLFIAAGMALARRRVVKDLLSGVRTS